MPETPLRRLVAWLKQESALKKEHPRVCSDQHVTTLRCRNCDVFSRSPRPKGLLLWSAMGRSGASVALW